MLYSYAARPLIRDHPGAAFFVLQLSRRRLADYPGPEAVKKIF